MKMAELSRESGVPVATIKFYLREGLLAPGERTHANQAEYTEQHLKRLHLIRAMVAVAQMPLATMREILAAIDDPSLKAHAVFGIAQQGLMVKTEPPPEDELPDRLVQLMEQRKWHEAQDNAGWKSAASVLHAFSVLGAEDLTALLDEYAEAAEIIARADIAAIVARNGLASRVEGVLIGTALGDVLFASLRRIAQQQISAEQFGRS